MKFMEISSIRQCIIHPRNHDLVNGDNFFQGSQIDATLLQKERKKKKRRNTSRMVGDLLT
jgi:hypothetical protein